MTPDIGLVALLGCFPALALAAPQSQPEKLIEEGHWKQARALVEPWIRQKPNDPLASFLLSQIRNAFHDLKSPRGLAENAGGWTAVLPSTTARSRKYRV
jgi:hypothetical protein